MFKTWWAAPARAPDQPIPSIPPLRSPYDDVPLILHYLCYGSPPQVKQAIYQSFHPATRVVTSLFTYEFSVSPGPWTFLSKEYRADPRDMIYLYWRLVRWLCNNDFNIEILDRDFRTVADLGVLRLRRKHTFTVCFIPRFLYHPVAYFDSVFLLRRQGVNVRSISLSDGKGFDLPQCNSLPPTLSSVGEIQVDTKEGSEQLAENGHPIKSYSMKRRRPKSPAPCGILKYASEPRNPATWPRGWNYWGHGHDKVVHFAESLDINLDKPHTSRKRADAVFCTPQDLIRRIDLSKEALLIGEYIFMLVVGKQQAMSLTARSTWNLVDMMSFLANDSETCYMVRFLSAFYQQPRYEALQQALAHGTACCHFRNGCTSDTQYPLKELVPQHFREFDFGVRVCQLSGWCVEQLNDMESSRSSSTTTSNHSRGSQSSECSGDTAISSVDSKDDSGTYFDWHFTDPIAEDVGADGRPRVISNKNVKDYISVAPTGCKIIDRPGRAQLLRIACHSSRENNLKKMHLMKRRWEVGVNTLLDLETEMGQMARDCGTEHTSLLQEGTRKDLHSHRTLAFVEEETDSEEFLKTATPISLQTEGKVPYAAGDGGVKDNGNPMLDDRPWEIIGQRDVYTIEELLPIYMPTPVVWIAILMYRIFCVVWAELVRAFSG